MDLEFKRNNVATPKNLSQLVGIYPQHNIITNNTSLVKAGTQMKILNGIPGEFSILPCLRRVLLVYPAEFGV